MTQTGYRIPFNRPTTTRRGRDYVAQALGSATIAGNGPFTRRAEAQLQAITGAHRALLTTSCTAALEMAALLLLEATESHGGGPFLDAEAATAAKAAGPHSHVDLAVPTSGAGSSDPPEVIVPTFTFVSTANAFAMHGWRPVFADCRPDTLNIDERALPALITARTRAIVVMHYGGVACEMEAIQRLAQAHDLVIVEDNAHGLFGRYKGRPLGTFGALATQSFHETKNVTTGEGGALLVNDPALVSRAEVIREKGTNRASFFRGEVDKYTWVDVGSNYLMSDVQAALLLAQLESWEEIQQARRAIWNRYDAGLRDWADAHDVRRPVVPAGCDHPAHVYYLLLPSADSRTRFIEHLKSRGILAVFHYVPLHLSPMGRRLGAASGDHVTSGSRRLSLATEARRAQATGLRDGDWPSAAAPGEHSSPGSRRPFLATEAQRAQAAGLRASAGECPVAEDISTRLVRLPLFTALGEDDQAAVIEAVRAFRV